LFHSLSFHQILLSSYQIHQICSAFKFSSYLWCLSIHIPIAFSSYLLVQVWFIPSMFIYTCFSSSLSCINDPLAWFLLSIIKL
jgi:hypothetical protein